MTPNNQLAEPVAERAEIPAIKRLEWQEPSKATNGCWTAKSPLGTYSVVNEDGWYACRDDVPRDFYFEWSWRDMSRDNLLTAQAACQADFEARIRSALASPAAISGEGSGAVAWREFDHTTIDYVLRYGGRCRECADHLGLCPNGLPCNVDDAKTAIRWVLKALNYGIIHGFVVSPCPAALATAPEGTGGKP